MENLGHFFQQFKLDLMREVSPAIVMCCDPVIGSCPTVRSPARQLPAPVSQWLLSLLALPQMGLHIPPHPRHPLALPSTRAAAFLGAPSGSRTVHSSGPAASLSGQGDLTGA